MYILLALFLSIVPTLWAMEKEQEQIIEAESSLELVLDGVHHILPLKDVLNHLYGCQQVPKSREELTISGFHVYPSIKTTSDGKETISAFSPLHKVLALGDITKFHKGYVVYFGVACPKAFFPVGWQRKDIIAYIHRLMAEGTVKIKEEAQESSSSFKTYQVTLVPSQAHSEDTPLYMVLKGCPKAERLMRIITLFPLIKGNLSSLEVSVHACIQEQKKYLLEQRLPCQQAQRKKRVKVSKLFTAIEQKDFQRVTHLISLGANIEGATQEGTTPLMKAARSGEWELVSLLLLNNASKTA